ncbi:MAG: PD-(D/E)XK motif protein [Granulosicoccus sp.]
MSTEPDGAARAWMVLRSDRTPLPDGGIPVRLPGVATSSGSVRYAIGAADEARLLMPIAPGVVPPRINCSEAVSIDVVSLRSNAKQGTFLDLTCLDRALENVFADVCDVVVNRVRDGHEVVDACVSTFAEFAELFRLSGSADDPRSVRGLLGELLYLESLLTTDPRALLLWRGHHGEPVDFRGGSHAVEIKTTTRAGDSVVTISSLEQLVPPKNGTLSLRVYELAESAGSELSVYRLVKRLSERVHDPAAFFEALASVGCHDPGIGLWRESHFLIGQVRQWRVKGDFPRITRDSLAQPMAGLVSASYQIRPGDVPQYLLDEAGEEQIRTELLQCLND